MLQGFGEVRLRLRNAKLIALAFSPDDTDWCRSRAEKDELILEVETQKPGAMLNAYDDYFLNLIAALSAIDALEVTK
jgi:hypothetical protein